MIKNIFMKVRGIIKWNYKTDESILIIQKKYWFVWITIHKYIRTNEEDFESLLDWWEQTVKGINFIER